MPSSFAPCRRRSSSAIATHRTRRALPARAEARLDADEHRLHRAVVARRYQGRPASGNRRHRRTRLLGRHAAGGGGRLRRRHAARGRDRIGRDHPQRPRDCGGHLGCARHARHRPQRAGRPDRHRPALRDRQRRRSGEAGAHDPDHRALLRHPADAAQSAADHVWAERAANRAACSPAMRPNTTPATRPVPLP